MNAQSNSGRHRGTALSACIRARSAMQIVSSQRVTKLLLVAFAFTVSFAATALPSDYAGAISAYRRSHGLPAVRSDGHLGAVALMQARAMASSGSISHSAAGSFEMRMAPLRRARAAENIGAGYIGFAEMLREWEHSAGHRQNLLMAGARRVGVASVGNPRSPYRKFWALVISD